MIGEVGAAQGVGWRCSVKYTEEKQGGGLVTENRWIEFEAAGPFPTGNGRYSVTVTIRDADGGEESWTETFGSILEALLFRRWAEDTWLKNLPDSTS